MSPTFVRLLIVQAAFGISYSAFLLLPKFLKKELAATAAEIGWVTGVGLVGAALVSPLIGVVARRFDRRVLLAASLIMQGGASLGFVLVASLGPLAYFLRLSQGIAFTLLFNCTTTMAADLLDSRDLARGVGYLGVAMMLTNALAPLVIEPIAEYLSWNAAFSISGLLALVALTALPSMVDPSAPEEKTSDQGSRPEHLGPIYYASLLMGAGLGAMFTFVQPFALDQGANRVGQFFLGYVTTAVGVRIAMGRLIDRVGPAKVSVLGLAFYALVLLSTSELKVELLIPLGAGLGVAHGFLYPALSAAGLVTTTSSRRPIFMGWFACAFNAGFAVTVLMLGPVADRFGYSTMFLIVGLWIASGVPFLIRIHRQERATAVST